MSSPDKPGLLLGFAWIKPHGAGPGLLRNGPFLKKWSKRGGCRKNGNVRRADVSAVLFLDPDRVKMINNTSGLGGRYCGECAMEHATEGEPYDG
jgi:hypothetical protein